MTTLVIVESPNKVKKISSILGPSYKVMASIGHVRDLPRNEMGIEPPTFVMNYQPTERGKDVLAKLAAAAKQAAHVLLATDPDREGEAIAWHLADALKLKQAQRVTFTAITKDKVLEALENARPLDMPSVHAQEARRALDRIIGYRVSPALSQATGQSLGAGRVQSPAVRLVVDREREILNFKVTQHYGAELVFTGEAGQWKAAWDSKPFLLGDDPYFLDRAFAKLVAGVREVVVSEFEDTQKGRKPAAPFTTSTLQQAAGTRLKLKPKRTMELAQKLYEQGAITYHRTDAPNMDTEGEANIALYAASAGLPLADVPRKWKAKEGAQEGHEAIRPTEAAHLECGENAEERALYQLIWQRAVASQLADAQYAVRNVVLTGNVVSGPGATAVSFKATGRTLVSSGWLAVYAEDKDEDAEPDDTANNPIPALTTDERLVASDGKVLSKKTRPPVRFKEPTLVAELERLGIGRPSTYAAILDNITSREYLINDKKGYLSPSPVGELVRDGLVDKFAFIDLDYTRKLERQLDEIASGSADYHAVVADAWQGLDNELGLLQSDAPPCPTCQQGLRRLKGKFGFFWVCSDRECKTILPDKDGEPGERKAAPPSTGFHCAKCNKELARRTGTSKAGKPYDFYGCTGFPKCKENYKTGADGKPVF